MTGLKGRVAVSITYSVQHYCTALALYSCTGTGVVSAVRLTAQMSAIEVLFMYHTAPVPAQLDQWR
jgi:hypothetical protein